MHQQPALTECCKPITKMDSLPDEIVHQIFHYLDRDSIKRFSITCKRFANIVADSSHILKQFKLKLRNDFWKSENDLLQLRRKYSAIEIVDVLVNWHSALSKIFTKFGPQLRTLSIYNSTIDDFTFITVLKCSPFLEELCMSEVTIEKKLPAINPSSCMHLTSVSIHHTNWLVFKFLSRSQITSLLINNYLNEGEGTRSHLVSMLSYQNRLRELILHGTSSKTLFRDRDLNDIWNNRLSKFHIECGFGKNKDAVDRNIIDFLILNNESLRNVKISTTNCEQITIFALLNLGNVTSLTLNYGRLLKENSFYGALVNTEPNLQLKHLKLSGFFYQPELVEVILSKLPAIVNLELDDWSSVLFKSTSTLKFVAENLHQLEKLYIPAISKNAKALTFGSLKHLRVSCIRNIEHLINFIQRNPSLNTLQIGLVYFAQVQSIGKLLALEQLQHLSFAGGAKSLQMIFNLIQVETPKTLKTLELYLLSNDNHWRFSTTSRNAIHIHFPNNSPHVRARLNAFFSSSKLG